MGLGNKEWDILQDVINLCAENIVYNIIICIVLDTSIGEHLSESLKPGHFCVLETFVDTQDTSLENGTPRINHDIWSPYNVFP